MKDKMHNFDKNFTSKENKLHAKLDKLNNNVKKLDKYIKENNNEKINIKEELDAVKNKRDNLLLKYDTDMPYLENEEEAAENIADINERIKK